MIYFMQKPIMSIMILIPYMHKTSNYKKTHVIQLQCIFSIPIAMQHNSNISNQKLIETILW
jgi:hypothetical protein